MNQTQLYQVKTHTYWMTVKEYIKWSKTTQVEVPFNNSNSNSNVKISRRTRTRTRNRTHIHFI